MVPASVGVDNGRMYEHDVAVNVCSGYNLIAPKSLPLGWEQCIIRDRKVASFAGSDETPLQISSVVSVAMRFGSTAYRTHFVIADGLGMKEFV